MQVPAEGGERESPLPLVQTRGDHSGSVTGDDRPAHRRQKNTARGKASSLPQVASPSLTILPLPHRVQNARRLDSIDDKVPLLLIFWPLLSPRAPAAWPPSTRFPPSALVRAHLCSIFLRLRESSHDFATPNVDLVSSARLIHTANPTHFSLLGSASPIEISIPPSIRSYHSLCGFTRCR